MWAALGESLVQPSPAALPLVALSAQCARFLYHLFQHLYLAERFSADVLPIKLVKRCPLNWTGAFVLVEGRLRAPAVATPLSAEQCAAWKVTVRRRRRWKLQPPVEFVSSAGMLSRRWWCCCARFVQALVAQRPRRCCWRMSGVTA